MYYGLALLLLVAAARAGPVTPFVVVMGRAMTRGELGTLGAHLERNGTCGVGGEPMLFRRRTVLRVLCPHGWHVNRTRAHLQAHGLGNVLHLEPDHPVTLPTPPPAPGPRNPWQSAEKRAGGTQSSAPYPLDRMDSRPLAYDGLYHYYGTGTGVKMYTIDTGVRATHNEFTGRATAWLNTLTGGSAADDNGHGTHVASLMIGVTYGMSKAATLKATKALDNNGVGSVSSVVSAIVAVNDDCAASPNDLYVINMSLEGPVSDSICSALNSLRSTCHIALAVASGNSGQSTSLNSPANCPGILVVGATDADDAVPSWVSRPATLYAPGVSVTGAWLTSDSATAVLSGTSMVRVCARTYSRCTGLAARGRALRSRHGPGAAQLDARLDQCGRLDHDGRGGAGNARPADGLFLLERVANAGRGAAANASAAAIHAARAAAGRRELWPAAGKSQFRRVSGHGRCCTLASGTYHGIVSNGVHVK